MTPSRKIKLKHFSLRPVLFAVGAVFKTPQSNCEMRTAMPRAGHRPTSSANRALPRCYYIRLYLLSPIIRIKTLLKHIKTLLYQLLHSEFLDFYIILYHNPEIRYYIKYITPIISIIFFTIKRDPPAPRDRQARDILDINKGISL